MDENVSAVKHSRILSLYTRLLNGDVINKFEEACRYGVNERSIQRDIDDLRAFLCEDKGSDEGERTIVYDRTEHGYRLEASSSKLLSNSEALAVIKIILESRAFCREELEPILEKLLNCTVPRKNYKRVKALVSNERFHYIPPQHNSPFVDKLWDIGVAVDEHRILSIDYYSVQRRERIRRTLEPMGIMFSEFYFYLVAFLKDKPRDFPAIYRIDRIRHYRVEKEHFFLPYRDRFEEGEFRKRIQFMYGGELRKLEFKFRGDSVEAVLDRLPTARIVNEEDGVYTIRAEAYGEGVDMWLKSQGDWITDIRRL